MKRHALIASVLLLGGAIMFVFTHDLRAQVSKLVEGKDFKLPVYFPASNGVRRVKTVVTGERWRFATNGIVHLTKPGITNYHPNGTLEWIATSPECTVDVNTKEARGNTNIFFKMADERLVQTGVGFLWQQSNSVLIVSNQVHTWIDRQALTRTASTNK